MIFYIILCLVIIIILAIIIWGVVTKWKFIKRKDSSVIALLLTRDEAPLLEDWLPRMSHRYEKIFVLDGSLIQRKESKTLLEKFGAIYLHDQDITLKTDHGLRKPVLKEIKKYVKRFPNKEFWVQVAHADEFYTDDLKNTIAIAKKAKADHVAYAPIHNFPHISELSEYKKTKSHKTLRHFHDSNSWEQRLFKLSDSVDYIDNKHSGVLPSGLKKGINVNSPFWHYKIYRPDVSFYTKDGKEKTSSWTHLKSHYPDGHKFEKLEDFFIKEPSGIFKGAKIHIWSMN